MFFTVYGNECVIGEESLVDFVPPAAPQSSEASLWNHLQVFRDMGYNLIRLMTIE